jgi:hypothetical protein
VITQIGEWEASEMVRRYVGGYGRRTEAIPDGSPSGMCSSRDVSSSGSLSVVYEAQSGLLTVATDGYSVKPGQRFADLVPNIR